DLSRIRIRPEPVKGEPVQTELPVTGISAMEIGGVSLPRDPAASSLPSRPSGPEHSSAAELRPGESDLIDMHGQPPPAPSSVSTDLPAVTRIRPKSLTPRRRITDIDELPPDYVYPRRYVKPSVDMLDSQSPCRIG